MKRRFTVELDRVGKTATMFRIPFDLTETFRRARPPVKVTIRGHTWRTTPGVYGGVGYIGVNRGGEGGDGHRRSGSGRRRDGARHGASPRAPPERPRPGAGGRGGEGRLRSALLHPPARIRRVGAGCEAPGDTQAPDRAN